MNHSQTPDNASTKTFSFARMFTPKGTKSFTYPDQPTQAGSPLKKSGLDAYARKNKQTLPPDFSDQILEHEMELEKPDVSLDVVNRLTELYTEAMAHYEAEGNHKYKYFNTKLQNLMMKSSVKEVMLKEMDGDKSDQEKIIRRMRFDNKVNSISTDVEAFTLVKKQESTEKELNKVLEGDLSTQKDRFRQRLAERKNRAISRAQSVTTISDENSSATDEATRDAEFDSPLKQDPLKKLNKIEEVDESRYATPPRKRNKEGHIVFYHKEKKGNKLVEIEDDVKKPHKSNRRHSMHREPVVSVVKVQNRMSRAQSFGNNKILPVIDRLKPIAPLLLSPAVEVKSAEPTDKKDLKELMSRAKSQGLLLASANKKDIAGITEENESDSSSSDSSASSNQDINAKTTDIQEKPQVSSINEVAPESTNEGEKFENKTVEANEKSEVIAENHSAQPVEAKKEPEVDQNESVKLAQHTEDKESNQVAEDTQKVGNVEQVQVIEASETLASEESVPTVVPQKAEQTIESPSTDAHLNETGQQSVTAKAVEISEAPVKIETHNTEEVKSIEAVEESQACKTHTTQERVEAAEAIQSATSDLIETEELEEKDQKVEITISEQSSEIAQVDPTDVTAKSDVPLEVIQPTETNEEAILSEVNIVEIDKNSEEHQIPVFEASTEVQESNHVQSSNQTTEDMKLEKASVTVEPVAQESSEAQISEPVTALEAEQATQEEVEKNSKADEVQTLEAFEVSEVNQESVSAENLEAESVLAVKPADPVEPVKYAESVELVKGSKDSEPQNVEENKQELEVQATEVSTENEKVIRKRTDSEAVNEKRQAAMKQIDQENQALLEEFVNKQTNAKEEFVKTIELKFEKKLKSMEDDMDDDEKVGAMWQKVLAKMSKDKETEIKVGVEKLEQEQLGELEKYKKKLQQQKMFKIAQVCSEE